MSRITLSFSKEKINIHMQIHDKELIVYGEKYVKDDILNYKPENVGESQLYRELMCKGISHDEAIIKTYLMHHLPKKFTELEEKFVNFRVLSAILDDIIIYYFHKYNLKNRIFLEVKGKEIECTKYKYHFDGKIKSSKIKCEIPYSY